MELTLHSIDTSRKSQTVFQYFCCNKCTTIETVHSCTTNNTLMVHITQTCHIFSLLGSTCNRQIMVMAETRTKHFILPIGISTCILYNLTSSTKLRSRSHIKFLQDVIYSYIRIVSNVGFTFCTILGSNDDDTIGSLGTIDGCSCSITEHIYTLNIIRSNHRYIHTRNTIYDIIWLHGRTFAKRRRTTERNTWRTTWITCSSNYQTSNLTLQHLTRIGKHPLVQVFRTNGSNRRSQILTAHRTITYNYDLIQGRIVFLQNNLTVGTGLYGLWRETDI